MGTSSWQGIPFCIEVLMKVAPRRVLDIGVGFGRWGMIVREFCDVWYGRIFQNQWAVHVEGVEAFPKNIAPYHEHFYNKIHVADAAEFLRKMEDRFDIVIFGDVLEHFKKDVGLALLETSLRKSDYTIINIPLGDSGDDWSQDELYGNPFEKHLSTWTATDFDAFPVVRRSIFQDHICRSYGSFVLSESDPKGVAISLFSEAATRERFAGQSSALSGEVPRILKRISELRYELHVTKNDTAYRIASRIRHSFAWHALRWLKTRNSRVALVCPLGQKNDASQGCEVWLLSAKYAKNSPPIPWDFMEMPDGPWIRKGEESAPYGEVITSSQRRLRIPMFCEDPVLSFLKHPWSGKVRIRYSGKTEVLDLYAAAATTVEARPARTPMISSDTAQEPVQKEPRTSSANPLPVHTTQPAELKSETLRPLAAPDAESSRNAVPQQTHQPAIPVVDRFSNAERQWLDDIRQRKVPVLAVYVPRWLGVTASTTALFEYVYAFPASPDSDPFRVGKAEIRHHAELILESGVPHLVCSGGERIHYDLICEIKRENPDIRCDVLWHGSYIHFNEDYAWSILKLWIDGAKEGVVHTIGTAKKGMDKFFEKIGCRSKFVMNYVPEIPTGSSTPEAGGPHVGIWLSGENLLKLPYVMLAGIKMVPGAVVHGGGFSERAKEVIRYFSIPSPGISNAAIPKEQMLEAIQKTHLSLYVTFTECCPMLPLESLSVGVPCLIGPASHLFEDSRYLYNRLVVPFPDRADVIAQYIRKALDDRERIVEEYIRYAPGYNANARRSVGEFLYG